MSLAASGHRLTDWQQAVPLGLSHQFNLIDRTVEFHLSSPRRSRSAVLPLASGWEAMTFREGVVDGWRLWLELCLATLFRETLSEPISQVWAILPWEATPHSVSMLSAAVKAVCPEAEVHLLSELLMTGFRWGLEQSRQEAATDAVPQPFSFLSASAPHRLFLFTGEVSLDEDAVEVDLQSAIALPRTRAGIRHEAAALESYGSQFLSAPASKSATKLFHADREKESRWKKVARHISRAMGAFAPTLSKLELCPWSQSRLQTLCQLAASQLPVRCSLPRLVPGLRLAGTEARPLRAAGPSGDLREHRRLFTLATETPVQDLPLELTAGLCPQQPYGMTLHRTHLSGLSGDRFRVWTSCRSAMDGVFEVDLRVSCGSEESRMSVRLPEPSLPSLPVTESSVGSRLTGHAADRGPNLQN